MSRYLRRVGLASVAAYVLGVVAVAVCGERYMRRLP